MSFPTATNDQITDSLTQSNTEVLGVAPAISMGNLYMATSNALSLAAHNATLTQQLNNSVAQQSTAVGVLTLYSLGSAASGISLSDILSSQPKGL
jgi:hypothetical protein